MGGVKYLMESELMRIKVAMYAYKDWLRKLDAGIHPREARIAIEKEYLLTDVEKASLSIPMQKELEMRIPKQ